MINEGKTEEYTIKNKNCNNEWKKCKLLGSILDTENDLSRRKNLAIVAANKLHHIFENKKISITVKTSTFKAYIEPIFLYNSEVWTLTKTMDQQINAFQRKLIRTFILNVKWPIIIKNSDAYEQTKLNPWSYIIEIKRLKWFGKVARMNNATPARQALSYAMEDYKKVRGRPRTTWLSMITEEIKTVLIIDIRDALEMARNEIVWNEIIDKHFFLNL